MSLIVLDFVHSSSVLSFYIDVVLTLSIPIVNHNGFEMICIYGQVSNWLCSNRCIFQPQLNVVIVVVVILFPTEYKQWRTEQMSDITTTINIDDPVGGHQRSQRLIGLDNTVLNDASYLTWYILGVIMTIIDTPVSFRVNYRSEWERWRVACGSSFYTIIDLWFVNVDSINVHLWYHNG